MTVSHDLGRTYESTPDAPSRVGGYGRLAPQFGAPPGGQVRAECDLCGTHLLAVPHADGTLEGVCPVCLSPRLTRVQVRLSAA
jgi:hypothetical protein